jgi:glyoxylase I family protein
MRLLVSALAGVALASSFVAPGGASASAPSSASCAAARPALASAGESPAAAGEVEIGGIQHAGVIVANTAKAMVCFAHGNLTNVIGVMADLFFRLLSPSWESQEFYTGVLGLSDETHLRPNLPFPGAFVRAGAQQIHIMELPNPDPIDGRPEHGGRDRHMAFSIRSLIPLKKRLDDAGVAYTMSMSGRAALFCRDPDGNAFEFMETANL